MATTNEIQRVDVKVHVPEGVLAAQDQMAYDHLLKSQALVIDIKAEPAVLAMQVQIATEQATVCRKGANQREELRKGWTKPILDSKKVIDDSFKVGTQYLTEAASVAGAKAVEGQREQVRRINEKNRLIEEENAKQRKMAEQANALAAKHADKTKAPPMPIAPVVQAKETVVKTAPTRKTWVPAVTKAHKAHDKIVLDYLKLSGKFNGLLMEALRAKVKAAVADGTITAMAIPGVKIEQTETFVAR